MKRIGLLLFLAGLASCGDTAAPPYPPSNPAPAPAEPGLPTEEPPPADEPGPAATNKYAECAGEECVHGFAFGTVHYVVFADASEGLNPATDEYVDVPGSFDITFVPHQDDNPPVGAGTGPNNTLYSNFALPADVPLGLGFERHLTLDFHVVDLSGTHPNIECHLELSSNGLLSGAIVREPGVLVCSTHNWASPQSPEEPGLLLEYALCGGSAASPCAY